MKRSKFTEAQIIFAIKQSERGIQVEEVYGKMDISEYPVSITRACKVVAFHRSGWYYCFKARDSSVIRKRLQEIAQVRVRYGFWRIFILLRRDS